ncbi:putative drug exporter of the RND superfamily [Geodermatophilus dictyosporus]|uniref:Putative drug exporter of the RND superfamily n=1 Tax=Geodermatophilus dictyosporus TaxID=1523247 RepID=A0A1I5MNC1_9ACTN|nr:MMPL family transporter [Geodermatophilus dictyosporus]SFP11020.1 putative drug exporter of the RND superfamily [Geodermatophilus dictyosporus]
MARRARWLLPLVVLLLWLGAAGPLGALSGKLTGLQENDTAAFLPDSAESTRVAELQQGFSPTQSIPAILLWEGEGPLDQTALGEIAQRAEEAAAVAEEAGFLAGEPSPPIPSEDGEAVQVLLPLTPEIGDEIVPVVEDVRSAIAVDGTSSFVTGPGGIFADFANGFAGIDGLLLLAAFGVVLVILLVVYRSPLLPFLVIGTAGLALTVGNAVAYLLADNGLITVNGQSQGIASILVVGAATDYGLLLVSRFREELRREQSRFTAMRTALRRSWEPIVASGATVVLGVLCLLFSDLSSNRGLGPISAVSVSLAVVAALTFLPAALTLLGRAAFWPFRPRYGSEAPQGRGWQRVAALVGRRPRRVLALSTLALVAAALFAPTYDASGITFSDAIRGESDGVDGQEALARHFDAGSGSPTVVVTPEGSWPEVAEAAAATEGVASVVPFTGGPPGGDPVVVDGLVRLDVTLAVSADSTEAIDVVQDLRGELDDADPQALVGGDTASNLDARETAGRDLRVIVPSVLVVITVVLALLLRALVAPLLLVATVVLSVGATVGVAALLFDDVFGFPGSDPGILLIGFVFLVALGIDYNIFLMTRAREESARHGTRDGVLRALAVTGGVITSAGLVLAATFGALSVLPLLFLTQLSFLVGFGVLLDTFVVRSLVVPAAVALLGDRTWWPSRLARRPHPEPERELEPV